jgi:hypothetical protein
MLRYRGPIYDVVAWVQSVGERQLALVALPESFARCFGQVVEVNPLSAGIACKLLASGLPCVMLLPEDVVGIEYVRSPECRFRGGRINRQSNLPTALEFDLVFLKIGLVFYGYIVFSSYVCSLKFILPQ